ncbi:class II glutamine amidotransferase domain-containing protein [Paractinoplanes durhamensis]|uniref:hypothetical protein n=1 Tax=Paractinoplanes durhamensis TaxID=113563 RepID=UPI001943593A|nr:hypothetical protein [Actinoplanes durhamensis]
MWSPPGHATVTVLGPVDDLAIDEATIISLGATHVVHAPMPVDALLAAVRSQLPGALIAGFGEELTVLKDVGHPRALAAGWGLDHAQGWQGVGHTRMATESAVTPSGAHPYAVGPDQCLVHNGSFANHATIRRHLKARGVVFDSENDTEVGARFVAQQIADGRDVESALKDLCAQFDGFYTLLVSNRDSFAVVRDAIACKPAVIAETDAWVAMASEYRALVGLPGIEKARIFEPEPERIYAWTR